MRLERNRPSEPTAVLGIVISRGVSVTRVVHAGRDQTNSASVEIGLTAVLLLVLTRLKCGHTMGRLYMWHQSIDGHRSVRGEVQGRR